MTKKENYQTPEVDVFMICLEGNLLQASLQGFTNDQDFDPGFFDIL